MEMPMVKIQHPDDPERAILINQADFDPQIHKRWKPPRAKAESSSKQAKGRGKRSRAAIASKPVTSKPIASNPVTSKASKSKRTSSRNGKPKASQPKASAPAPPEPVTNGAAPASPSSSTDYENMDWREIAAIARQFDPPIEKPSEGWKAAIPLIRKREHELQGAGAGKA